MNGSNKQVLRRENKLKRKSRQMAQDKQSYWHKYDGLAVETTEMDDVKELEEYVGEMCPKGLALHHPAAAKLLQYATGGCPVNAGAPWTLEMLG